MAFHAKRIGVGRHRLGLPGRRHCRELPAMRPASAPRAMLSTRRGRHTFRGLLRTGASPRPVLAIIASL